MDFLFTFPFIQTSVQIVRYDKSKMSIGKFEAFVFKTVVGVNQHIMLNEIVNTLKMPLLITVAGGSTFSL